MSIINCHYFNNDHEYAADKEICVRSVSIRYSLPPVRSRLDERTVYGLQRPRLHVYAI